MEPKETNTANFWKRKLADFLHDPPSKCLDIRTHGERSDQAFRQAGFVDEDIGEYFAHADHTAAAADRLPFPKSQPAGLSCHFDGVRNAFRHPLCGSDTFVFGSELRVELASETESGVQPVLSDESLMELPDDAARWRARYFAHWRLWARNCREKDHRLAFLPADTRIPDHTIWNHMQVVSAIGGCVQADKVWKPAFLKFQLGPVQDFIAAARSTRDLWSGSYLLSWLMAVGIKALSEQTGPDAILFPSLREQPLFDLQWRKDLWDRVRIGDTPVWSSLGWSEDQRDLLTPNLPNVFLAIVPADRAGELGRRVSEAIQKEWKTIAGAVWSKCEKVGLTADEGGITELQRKARFDQQVEGFLSLSWQATSWPDSLDAVADIAKGFADGTPVKVALSRVDCLRKMAEEQMPSEHRDGRYYQKIPDKDPSKLNNTGLAWSVLLAVNGWQLDAVRQTRDFAAANEGGWTVGTFNNKDALTGREEAVAGGDVWIKRAEGLGSPWRTLFKKSDWLGAPTLIKRVWHLAYLQDVHGLKTDSRHFPMPSTRGVARHKPEEEDEDEDIEKCSEEKYFAVLAFDGDQIGKWVSGEKMPAFLTQLADYKDGSGKEVFGPKAYFSKQEFGDFLENKRPLSPSYHLQFSEALGNFALACARTVVEVFDGRLIYAGGDDVVALLPADTALACARALRAAFRGDPIIKELLAAGCRKANPISRSWTKSLAEVEFLLKTEHRGFLCSGDRKADQSGKSVPFIVPGSQADASVGIAIAHFKSSLQDVVREAQAAEKRAKRDGNKGGLGRAAVAVTLMKRSGEIHHWGSKWDSGGLDLFDGMLEALEADVVSSKFPHRVIELLSPYLSDDDGVVGGATIAEEFTPATAQEVILREIGIAAERQRGRKPSMEVVQREVVQRAAEYLAQLQSGSHMESHDAETQGVRLAPKVVSLTMIKSLIGLCQTVAFANRTSPKGNKE